MAVNLHILRASLKIERLQEVLEPIAACLPLVSGVFGHLRSLCRFCCIYVISSRQWSGTPPLRQFDAKRSNFDIVSSLTMRKG